MRIENGIGCKDFIPFLILTFWCFDMKKILSHLFVSACVLTTAACGTYYNGATSEVEFKVVGATQADCYLSNPDYNNHVTAPGLVTVQNSKYPYEVVCEQQDYRTFVGEITPKITESHYMNFLNLGVGAAVDDASNSVFEYPETFEVVMRPLDESNISGFSSSSDLTVKDTIGSDGLKFTYGDKPKNTDAKGDYVYVPTADGDMAGKVGVDLPIVKQTEEMIVREPRPVLKTPELPIKKQGEAAPVETPSSSQTQSFAPSEASTAQPVPLMSDSVKQDLEQEIQKDQEREEQKRIEAEKAAAKKAAEKARQAQESVAKKPAAPVAETAVEEQAAEETTPVETAPAQTTPTPSSDNEFEPVEQAPLESGEGEASDPTVIQAPAVTPSEQEAETSEPEAPETETQNTQTQETDGEVRPFVEDPSTPQEPSGL